MEMLSQSIIITLSRRIIIRLRTAKMDTANTVSRLSSRAELAFSYCAQEEDAEADSLAFALEPQVLKRLVKRSNMFCVSFPEVACTLAPKTVAVKTHKKISPFLTIFTDQAK